MLIKISNTICRSQDQVFTEIDGETVMMSISKGKYYSLDETGSRIWQLLEVPVSVSELIKTLRREYNDPENMTEQDVLALLQQLQNRELINVVTGQE